MKFTIITSYILEICRLKARGGEDDMVVEIIVHLSLILLLFVWLVSLHEMHKDLMISGP